MNSEGEEVNFESIQKKNKNKKTGNLKKKKPDPTPAYMRGFNGH